MFSWVNYLSKISGYCPRKSGWKVDPGNGSNENTISWREERKTTTWGKDFFSKVMESIEKNVAA